MYNEAEAGIRTVEFTMSSAAKAEQRSATNAPKRLEPRWPAMLALFAVGGLRLALPSSLSLGPDWLLLLVVGALMVPTIWARYRGLDMLNKILGYVVTSIVTAD